MLPENYAEKFFHKIETTRFFDTPINELSREELLACAIDGWERYTKEINRTYRGNNEIQSN